MKTTTKAAAATAAGAAVGLAAVRLGRSRVRVPAADSPTDSRNRWRAVTVNKPAAQAAPDGKLPEPLAALGDRVEVK